MSRQLSEDVPSANEALKFITYVIKSYQDQYGQPLVVDNDIMSENLKDDSIESINLTFEFDSENDEVIVRAVANGNE